MTWLHVLDKIIMAAEPPGSGPQLLGLSIHVPHYSPFVRGIHWLLVDSPQKGPVMRTIEIYFIVNLNKLRNSPINCRWLLTPRRSCDVTVKPKYEALTGGADIWGCSLYNETYINDHWIMWSLKCFYQWLGDKYYFLNTTPGEMATFMHFWRHTISH